MDDPEVIQEGADYIALFGGFAFRYRKLKEHSDGYSAILRVTAENHPVLGTGMLYENHHQLYGPNSKRDAASALKLRYNDEETDWTAMLTRAAGRIVDYIEEGQPIVSLADGEPEAEPNAYLLRPVLRLYEPTVLFGLGGTAKSLLAMASAICLTQGINYLADPFETTQQMRVLYLDWEDEIATQRWRLARLAAGLDMVERPDVLWKRCEVSFQQMADAIAKQIIREKIQYLIIDSAALACGDEPEKADAANSFFRALRSLGRTGIMGSLIIAHQPKEKERADAPFGSVFWRNNPRKVWKIQKVQEEGKDVLHVGLFDMKQNNSRVEMPLGLALEFDTDRISIRAERPADVPDLREHLTANSQIVDTVRRLAGARSAGVLRGELRAALAHLRKGTFDSALHRLLEGGRIVERDGRLWLGTQTDEAGNMVF